MNMNFKNFKLFQYSIRRSFVEKVNKYKDISAKVVIPPRKAPKDEYASDKYAEDKVGPPKGEYYTLPVFPNKGLAMLTKNTGMFKRDPVSSFYSFKVKDTCFHVFNASRYVRLILIFYSKYSQ
jgi:hypothetical protein